MHYRFRVIHEVDTALMQPLRLPPQESSICLPQGKDVDGDVSQPLLEEYRGFPQAMRALAALQKQRPNVHVARIR